MPLLAQRSNEDFCEFENVDNGFVLFQHFFFFPSVPSYFILARDEPHGVRTLRSACASKQLSLQRGNRYL